MEKLYEGKAKILYSTEKSEEVIIYYKDDVTAFNGEKKDNLKGKGVLNKKITKYFFEYLEENKIKTQYIEDRDESSFFAKKVKIVPLEVIVRNKTAGSFCKRYGVKKGINFENPLIEYSLKDDSLGDPMISKEAIYALKIISEEKLNYIEKTTLKINNLLKKILEPKKIDLVDFKLEYGYFGEQILLSDEISPDTCRFWDKETGESLDKDIYREDKGNLILGYENFIRRMGI
ncbi:phosphoribosylaminoimidazolesuccinocarboxamide synthase [Oceanotoga sp. DSM 15011]|jgi:phosphoribosylaminoimidazole-succinocarboxamide synthase|uniref:phosphoribosylaminoimidazolesuccinocarboxamide synthase n=1 Tax=Oceanotoga TaxID=1255275 RepID=UPI0021F45A99|nr:MULTISPECIES: phosphoribosylaminoimidazolesuccinocarboxamide synthase [Oceanotoga]MDN5342080.1 phosphoribosylaminoimidazole-succinocarboxamide synthase [Oceanotoga sp.]MDO7975450.1 phosphoribosylaminoimidazolesuccinocarboxamide synthase [Oceanotoga teriensis]UYP00046.1 phosphoribosylaminoimidazolesuccinocarboxamide synthase [Oceanotoga sp. DSM 15011]